jgi:toxin-antitoxin system PIN domain toxin
VQAIDTNLWIYAEISSSTHHTRAREVLTELAEGPLPWAIPWPCVYEFLRVVTHPRVFNPPMPPATALVDIAAVLSSPSLVLLSETPHHPAVLQEVLRKTRVTGNLVHDAHIAALCLEHGVNELITGDEDFRRFEQLRIINPFLP